MGIIVLIVLLCFFGAWIGFAIWARQREKMSWTISLGGGFILGCLTTIVVGFMVSIFIPNTEETKPPNTLAQAAAERKKMIEQSFSSWDGSHRGLETLIKESMNDPDSYQHVRTIFSDHGEFLVVTSTFRGKNAFGALVTSWVKAKVDLNGEVIEVIDQGR